jgi:hypothetical protein
MPSPPGNSDSTVIEAIGDGWNRFWFTPADPLPCCVLRIAVGLIAVLHFAFLRADLDRWYAADGLLTPSAVSKLLELSGETANHRYSYLVHFGSGELWIVSAVAIAAAALFAAGFLTRVTGVITLLAVLSYVHRIPQVAGHLEPLLSFLLAYLCVAPSGACLSLDSLLFRRNPDKTKGEPAADPRQPSIVASIGLGLIQVHLAMFCAMMGLSKLYGDSWWDGNAIWILLAQTQSRPLNLTALRGAGQAGEYLLNFWTHATVYFELAFPVLIWNRRTRPLLVIVGAVIWTALILATGNVLFGLALIVASAAFLPTEFYYALIGSRAAVKGASPVIAH